MWSWQEVCRRSRSAHCAPMRGAGQGARVEGADHPDRPAGARQPPPVRARAVTGAMRTVKWSLRVRQPCARDPLARCTAPVDQATPGGWVERVVCRWPILGTGVPSRTPIRPMRVPRRSRRFVLSRSMQPCHLAGVGLSQQCTMMATTEM